MLLADDHDLFRAGIRILLERDGFAVCAEAKDVAGAVAAAELHRPHVCLLDIGIPGDGIAAAEQIAQAVPSTAIVMLTASADDEHLFAAIRAGASGYLLKSTDPDRLGHALRGVLDGEAALPRELVARVLDEFRAVARSRRIRVGKALVELTPRESKILRLLGAGASTAAIGEQLGIKPATVRTHVSALVRKLEVANRRAAIELLRAQSH